MLDSIYHMTLKYLKKCSFVIKTTRFCHLFFCNEKLTSLCFVTKSVNHKWFIHFIAWHYITH